MCQKSHFRAPPGVVQRHNKKEVTTFAWTILCCDYQTWRTLLIHLAHYWQQTLAVSKIMRTDITLGRICCTQNYNQRSRIQPYTTNIGGQDSAVGIATRYGLDGPEIEPWWRRNFLYSSRPALSPTQPPAQRMPFCLFHGGKVAGDHLVCYRMALQQKHEQNNTTRPTIWTLRLMRLKVVIKAKQSLHRPWGFHKDQVPRFQENRHTKAVRLSALRTGRL